MSSYEYAGSLYNFREDAEHAWLYDWVTASGWNTAEDAIEFMRHSNGGLLLNLSAEGFEWLYPSETTESEKLNIIAAVRDELRSEQNA